MDSAERLLKLLGLLEGRIDWTAEELARRLEVTTRLQTRHAASRHRPGHRRPGVGGFEYPRQLPRINGRGGKPGRIQLDADFSCAPAQYDCQITPSGRTRHCQNAGSVGGP